MEGRRLSDLCEVTSENRSVELWKHVRSSVGIFCVFYINVENENLKISCGIINCVSFSCVVFALNIFLSQKYVAGYVRHLRKHTGRYSCKVVFETVRF